MKRNLSRVEINRRNRSRHKIMCEELRKYEISERRLYVDDTMYEGLKEVSESHGPGYNVHSALFDAIRDFLVKKLGRNYMQHPFQLDAAYIDAYMRMKSEGLGALRATRPSTTEFQENYL